MNPNEMSLEECRDFLGSLRPDLRLTRLGATEHRHDGVVAVDLWEQRWEDVWIPVLNEQGLPDHPIPATLDAIYAAMPEGWIIKWIAQTVTGEPAWCASAFKGPGSDAVDKPYASIRAPDLLTCWARLCVAMWLADAAR